MKGPIYRFYKGESENPFDDEKDVSRHTFWDWEANAVTQCPNPADWFDRFGDMNMEIVKNWNASKAEKGLLIYMMLMCGKWNPYAYAETDWALYTKTAA